MSPMGRPPVYFSSWDAVLPTTQITPAAPLVVAQYLQFTQPGRVVALRFYKSVVMNSEVIGLLSDATDYLQSARAARFHTPRQSPDTQVGWQTQYIKPYLRIILGHAYWLRFIFTGRTHMRTPGALTGPDIVQGPITTLGSNTTSAPSNTGTSLNLSPFTSANGDRMGVDVLFFQDGT